MRLLVAAAVVGACGDSSTSDDCKVVLDDPAHAMATITNRYPNDPVNATAVIERCVAPDRDDCEVSRVVETLKSAGYDSVLFAVKP